VGFVYRTAIATAPIGDMSVDEPQGIGHTHPGRHPGNCQESEARVAVGGYGSLHVVGPSNHEDAAPMLRYPEVGSVQLPDLNPVEAVGQVHQNDALEVAAGAVERRGRWVLLAFGAVVGQSRYVLGYEPGGRAVVYCVHRGRPHVPLIVGAVAFSCGAERLAGKGRPQHVHLSSELVPVLFADITLQHWPKPSSTQRGTCVLVPFAQCEVFKANPVEAKGRAPGSCE